MFSQYKGGKLPTVEENCESSVTAKSYINKITKKLIELTDKRISLTSERDTIDSKLAALELEYIQLLNDNDSAEFIQPQETLELALLKKRMYRTQGRIDDSEREIRLMIDCLNSISDSVEVINKLIDKKSLDEPLHTNSAELASPKQTLLHDFGFK